MEEKHVEKEDSQNEIIAQIFLEEKHESEYVHEFKDLEENKEDVDEDHNL